MRSATSYFNFTLFRKNLSRFWPIWGLYGLIWLVLLRRPMGPAGRKVVDAVAVSAVPFIMDFCAKRSLAETLGPSYSVLVPSVLEVALLRSQLRQALQA